MVSNDAVAARCRDCHREFYVTDEPQSCPYCGGEVGTEHAVIIQPH